MNRVDADFETQAEPCPCPSEAAYRLDEVKRRSVWRGFEVNGGVGDLTA